MATTKSNIHTIQTGTDGTKNDVGEAGGRVRAIMGKVIVPTADWDANGDILKLCQLPSVARVCGIWLMNEDTGSGEDDVDCGIFAADGAVIDADEFAVAIITFDTVTIWRDVLGFGLTTVEQFNPGLTMWERAGLTADTSLRYDIGLTQTATVVTPIDLAEIGFKIYYTVD